MKAKEIYEALCKFRNSEGKEGKAPAQPNECVRSYQDEDDGIDVIDVISHTRYEGDDSGAVEEVIASYAHSRTFEIRPDMNLFYDTLYDEAGNIMENSHYTQMDPE